MGGQEGSHWAQMRSGSGFRDGLRALHTKRERVQAKEISVCQERSLHKTVRLPMDLCPEPG